ncbi:cardiolipin synthase [Streptococcus loxodontisalivarius]|uniref:cardiolipin synthase n=1 Tax=Streptococcus loxodontisalivarius TaxID=1349415 RepID=UPI00195FFD31|nr:cardiolipin synthase [Streptococcus loxodontisalivarius]
MLDKGRRGLLRGIFSRITVIAVLLIVQLLILVASFSWLSHYQIHLEVLSGIIVTISVLYLVNSEMDRLSVITWMLLIIPFPIPGSLFLLYTKIDWGYNGLKAMLNKNIEDSIPYLTQNQNILKELKQNHSTTYNLARYLSGDSDSDHFPVYQDSKATYFPSGEAKFKALKEQLRAAKHYIFMEYFIIDEGIMWGEILAILEDKVKEGVEVRVMYDGMIEFSTLSFDYTERLEKIGIHAKAFSPISPFLSTYYNYRDHRKIVVIDGEVAFTGGVNLADEYINEIERFGHWKDTAIMIEGRAVDTFTILFMQMWAVTDSKTNNNYADYLGLHQKPVISDGFIIPYADSPLDDDKVGENVYIDILNHARDYVHIMTPYLILDSEMEHALKFAAERGVDVKLIMPGIPDKPIPYALAKTYYATLMKAGVKIYTYTPGFVHAKVFVADGHKAVVGTINLDYRSLYHHFECATYLYHNSEIAKIEKDFQDTLESCQEVTFETLKNEPVTTKLLGKVVKLIAPLL